MRFVDAVAPVAADVWKDLKPSVRLDVPRQVLSQQSHDLTEEAEQRLKELAGKLTRFPQYYLRIEGPHWPRATPKRIESPNSGRIRSDGFGRSGHRRYRMQAIGVPPELGARKYAS